MPADRAPLAPEDALALDAVTRPLGESSALPGGAYTSREVFDWEMERFFVAGWVCLGRSADLAGAGARAAYRVGPESVLLSRGEDGELRGFFNVCRHRGHELLPVGGSAAGRTIQCPYHGWAYHLDGRLRGAPGYRGLDPDEMALAPVRVAEWRGWAFANVSGDAPPLAEWLGNLDDLVAGHDPGGLVSAASEQYVVAANWKAVHENYHECYHCSNIHPELCRVTPPDSGIDMVRSGIWAGGSMDLRPHAQTMSFTGESGGTPIRSLDDGARRQVYYFGLFPNLLISLHPDYVLTHLLRPLAPDATSIECRWLFQPEDVERDGFDPGYAVEFWDRTNRQDWAAIESVQRGASSRAYRPGPLSERELCARQFDTIVAQGYLTGRPASPLSDNDPAQTAAVHASGP